MEIAIGSILILLFLLVALWRMGVLARRNLRARIAHLDAELASRRADAVYDPEPDDEDEDEAPAAKVVLPVVQASCGTCAHWNHALGQRAMRQNPAFARVMMLQEPYQQGWIRNPEHIAKEHQIVAKSRELDELQRELRATKLDPTKDTSGLMLSVDELQKEITALEAELAKIPEYSKGGLTDAGVKSSMGLTWDDFGACTEHSEIRAKTDRCEKHRSVEPTP